MSVLRVDSKKFSDIIQALQDVDGTVFHVSISYRDSMSLFTGAITYKPNNRKVTRKE